MAKLARVATLPDDRAKDLRTVGIYTVSDVARYLHVSTRSIRVAVFGDRSKNQHKLQGIPAPIRLSEPGLQLLSFTNLVEIYLLNAMRQDRSISLASLKQNLQSIQQKLENEHPLACRKLYAESFDSASRQLISAADIFREQLITSETVQQDLKRIEWDEKGLAMRLYPYTRSTRGTDVPLWVAIDPRIAFGQPVVAGTGIPTAMLAQRYAAGESIDELAADYDCDRPKIEEAIRYELAVAV